MATLPTYRGAFFHKCDFQIHTPRDINWSGPDVLQADRDLFARALVADCRRKGINAIAITDHHDLCIWRHVYAAALGELYPGEVTIPEPEKLVVFPGVELTLSVPACQCLLLLDPDLSEAQLHHIWGALGVTPNSASEAKTTTTHALSSEKTIQIISEGLSRLRINPSETNPSKFEYLAGRFILFPHVSGQGHKSIIRDGFAPVYKESPFVGGYVEGLSYSELKPRPRNVIEGKCQEWGSRPIGVFQTSDCREARLIDQGKQIFEFTGLGTWPTWIKWAEPTCEALRQACLARQSRITHDQPAYPSLHILGVSVSNSDYLGGVELGLSAQYSAFIGGRGTGKSSLLEYIRWALCDKAVKPKDTDEVPDYERRRKDLVELTLKKKNATVTVFYRKNGVTYRIERSIIQGRDESRVFNDKGELQPHSQEQIRTEFPIVAYSQKQLSSIGALPNELKTLIRSPINDRVQANEKEIRTRILPELRQQRQREINLINWDLQLKDSRAKLKASREQVLALESKLQTPSVEQRAVIDAHPQIQQLEQVIGQCEEIPKSIESVLLQAREQVEAQLEAAVGADVIEKDQVGIVAEAANAIRREVIAALGSLIRKCNSGEWLGDPEKTVLHSLKQKLLAHDTEYQSCLMATTTGEQQLKEITKLNDDIRTVEAEIAQAEAKYNGTKATYDGIGDRPWQEYLLFLKQRSELFVERCAQLDVEADQEIRPKYICRGDPSPVIAQIETIKGKKTRDSEDKIARLADWVVSSSSPVEAWQTFMGELDGLYQSQNEGTASETPLLLKMEFTPANIQAIAAGLTPQKLENIRYFEFEDLITLEYKMGTDEKGEERYIPFTSASPGQQATCLLRTLLSQAGAPLLIDQPEEDLDNEQIHVLSGKIAETKHRRQLLFVSHNANIVVNGDAELVACFSSRGSADSAHGEIRNSGSIDCKTIRDSIARVMEGGKEAFELRRAKYGF